MKTILLCSILFCVIALPALGELTDADLDKIRLIVNESEKRVKEETKSEITASEKRMKEYIDLKIEGVDKQFEGVEKRFSLVTTLIVGLMALIGIPLVALTVIIGWRSVKDSTPEKDIREYTSEDKKEIEQLIRDQDQKIESLTQEIETLKQKRTVNP